MPLPFFERDVLGSSKSTDWVCASSTLFGVEVAEAAQAVCKLIAGGKALSGQLLLASSTHEALLMPWLLPVGNASCSDSLLALDTLHGKLLFIAGYTKVLIVLRDEALCPNRLLAAVADKAGLVPAVALVFHLPSTWHNSLLALITFGRVFIGVAVSTKQMFLFCSKRFVHQ